MRRGTDLGVAGAGGPLPGSPLGGRRARVEGRRPGARRAWSIRRVGVDSTTTEPILAAATEPAVERVWCTQPERVVDLATRRWRRGTATRLRSRARSSRPTLRAPRGSGRARARRPSRREHPPYCRATSAVNLRREGDHPDGRRTSSLANLVNRASR